VRITAGPAAQHTRGVSTPVVVDGALELAGPPLADRTELGHLTGPLTGFLAGSLGELATGQRRGDRAQRRPGRSAVQP
jgi:hypothetical protein